MSRFVMKRKALALLSSTNFRGTMNGNHILNWPKLLRPFKTVCSPYVDVYIRNAILHHFQYKEIRLNYFNLCFRVERNRLRDSGAGRRLQLASYLRR